jgi:tetratricopeptide (TPR) repeat protein
MTKLHSMRGCLEWKNEGLSMFTTSDQACKLFDAALSQCIMWTDLSEFDGLETTLNNMLSSDTQFIMGHVIKNGIQLIGNSNPSYLSDDINEMNNLHHKLNEHLTKRELNHVKAILNLFNNDLIQACSYWEEILIENPLDLLAIKFLQDTYFYLGFQNQMKDSCARIMNYWKPHYPMYSYLNGLFSFGLVQTNYFDEAFKYAHKALESNEMDSWATHTVAHYYEYKNDFSLGIKFLEQTETNWNQANYLMGHNYWHLALYNIEKNDHEQALNIFDKIKNKTDTLDMVDLSSLLFRLKLDATSFDLKERWLELKDKFKSRVDHHGYTFNDCHILFILSGCNDQELKEEFLTTLKCYLNNSNGKNYLKSINESLANDLFESVLHFDNEEYEQVVDKLYKHKYEIVKIGGSNAQRDIFHQMLTISALKSNNLFHNKIGLNLINERLAIKPNSCLTNRIAKRFANLHQN